MSNKYGPTGALEASEPFGAFCNLTDISFGSTVGGSSADAGVYITGITGGQIDQAGRNCNVSPGITNGTNDQYLIKFDGELNKKWHKQFGSDYGTGITLGVAVDSEDKAYVVGYTNGEISDPAVFGEENNQGGRDCYRVKFEEYFDSSTAK